MITQPMLAATIDDVTKIKFPVLVSPKLDGIRCLKINGKALSRKFKPIPNYHIRTMIEQHCPDGFDGEIMAGSTFNECQSLVMSEDGKPQFLYKVFDYVASDLSKPYNLRIRDLDALAHMGKLPSWVWLIPPVQVNSQEELLQREAEALETGYEGLMLRTPGGPYKCGRSTVREGYLLKLKRFEDSEAVVIGFEELLTNENPQEKNELGYAKRSSKKANLKKAGTLGALLLRDLKSGIEFSLGTGFDDAQRDEIWKNQHKYMGKIVCYTHQKSGAKEKPRFPSFKGFRHEDDMS